MQFYYNHFNVENVDPLRYANSQSTQQEDLTSQAQKRYVFGDRSNTSFIPLQNISNGK